MLECVINHYSGGNKARFAAILGIRPQTINTWVARNTFDAELIYSKCEGISGDWLLGNGEGEMLNTSSVPSSAKLSSETSCVSESAICAKFIALLEKKDEQIDRLLSLLEKLR